jgi:hypothetical protein
LNESLTECEIEIFISLARGHRVAVRDHETGALWRGWVDMTFPEHGFVWVMTDFGARRLLDIGVHTVWRPDGSGACGSVRREAGNGTGQLVYGGRGEGTLVRWRKDRIAHQSWGGSGNRPSGGRASLPLREGPVKLPCTRPARWIAAS